MQVIATLTQVPGTTAEYAADGNTVANLLAAANIDGTGRTFYVNGQPAELNTEINDGDEVRVHRAPTTISVTVGIFPGAVRRVTLNGSRTLAEALAAAGLETNGYRVNVNGNPTENFAQTLSDNDKVFLTRQIKGN